MYEGGFKRQCNILNTGASLSNFELVSQKHYPNLVAEINLFCLIGPIIRKGSTSGNRFGEIV